MAITFDGPNLNIVVTAVGSYSAQQDIYSDWKVWAKLSDNAKYPPAFDTVGGDSIGSGQSISPFYFLRNDLGWRIQMPEQSGDVIIVGDIFPRDETLQMFLPPSGSFTVLIRQVVSSKSVTGLGSGLTAAEQSKLNEIYKRMGLDVSDPWNVSITNGEEYTDSRDIEVAVSGDGINTSRHVRQ